MPTGLGSRPTFSLPRISSLIETTAIRAADTEPMPARGLHDYPTILNGHNSRSQAFQARNLRAYRICLDIEARSRLMADFLNDNLHFTRRRYELDKAAS